MTQTAHRVELPYAVFVRVPGDTGMVNRSGRLVPNRRKRYFATVEEALAFCGGKIELVVHCPGEAWTKATGAA